ncbi:MAG: cytochrome ubiquinol oxidase subunit I [Candidatus Poribacteria bacterium]|nr:cytochrome ubiquinol oxidase subunit I [Candidatus Poribacteria bacterium]
MNYPFWEVPYLGGGMLIGLIATLHVFVSHFAVGGGLFLALMERRSYRNNDTELLSYVKKHTNFFLLLTVVFGAVSGVGIWFSIGLVHPEATSLLIRTFVWAWAIEWVFFAVEIAALLVYYSTWDKLAPKTHNLVGWIYFVSSFMSLIVINGILTFMLTPGKWLETGSFFDAFFNPTYLPSLIMRTSITLALAGVYAMFTGSFEREAFKVRIIPHASIWLMSAVPLLLVGLWWYFQMIPPLSQHIVKGGAPIVQMFAALSVFFSAIVFPFAYFLAYRYPRYFSPALGVLFLIMALGATAVTEWVREAVRKPYVIYGVMYSNAIYKNDLARFQQNGFLNEAKWTTVREFDPNDRAQLLAAGEQMFRGQCGHCHTTDGFNGVKPLVYGWGEPFLYEQIGRLNELRRFMPPFVGNDEERRALAAWLYELNGEIPPLSDAKGARDGVAESR